MTKAIRYPGIGGFGVHALIISAEQTHNLPPGTFKSVLVKDHTVHREEFDNNKHGYSSVKEALAAVLEYVHPCHNGASAQANHSFWLTATDIFMFEEVELSASY